MKIRLTINQTNRRKTKSDKKKTLCMTKKKEAELFKNTGKKWPWLVYDREEGKMSGSVCVKFPQIVDKASAMVRGTLCNRCFIGTRINELENIIVVSEKSSTFFSPGP